MTIAERTSRRPPPEVAVQLATRISLGARASLDQILAAEDVSIRTIVEDAIFERCARLTSDGGGVANG